MEKHIYFTRQIDQESSNKKTIISISGDKEGYRYFIDLLEKANTSKINLHVEINSQSYSMEVVILPTAPFRAYPTVKLFERPVTKNKNKDTWNMELVICGSKFGYNCLKEAFTQVLSKDFSSGWHQHIDEDTKWLAFNNIDMIIETPIEDWKQKNRDKDVKYYKKIPYSKDENVLPSIEFSEQSYQEVNPNDIEF
ncbi:hypothetical protein [Candidatus Uabimicrobium sp. HlEnr_7]|uniref:hypothetical protein n=1 Tax=Candidatus Uabimicrobium helgolandensis TaxID=3095367 RepID=UPI00355684C3